jgi:hypothetical protein
MFGEGVGDSGMGDVVAEHAVDHVADGMGKAGDFAVAGLRFGGAGGGGLFGGGWWILAGGFEA